MLEIVSPDILSSQEHEIKKFLNLLGRDTAKLLISNLQGITHDQNVISTLNEHGILLRTAQNPPDNLEIMQFNPFSAQQQMYEISLDGKVWFDALKVSSMFSQLFDALVHKPLPELSTREQMHQIEQQIEDYLYSIEQRLSASEASLFFSSYVRHQAYRRIASQTSRFAGNHFLATMDLFFVGQSFSDMLNKMYESNDGLGVLKSHVADDIVPIRDVTIALCNYYEKLAEEQAALVVEGLEMRFPGIRDVTFPDRRVPYDDMAAEYITSHDISMFANPDALPYYHVLSHYFFFLQADRLYTMIKQENQEYQRLDHLNTNRLLARNGLFARIPETGFTPNEAQLFPLFDTAEFTITQPY